MKTFINIGKYILTPIISYLSGFYMYEKTLNLVWNQSLGNDIYAVLYYGGLAFFLIATPIYSFLTKWINTNFKKNHLLLFPLVCMLIFIIPTMFITALFDSFNPFTAEALLFHAFFITSGCVFGLSTAIFNKLQFK